MIELKNIVCFFMILSFSKETFSTSSVNESTPLSQTLFDGEEKQFKIDRAEEKIKLSVILNGKVSVHEIISNYTFMTPKVDIVCDCNCRNSGLICSPNTVVKYKECSSLHNSTTTCTIYYDNDFNSDVCQNGVKSYKICCEAFFTKSVEDEGKFKALKLKYQKSYYNITVSMRTDCEDIKTFSLAIPEGVRTFLLTSNVVIEMGKNDSRPPLITDGWYFMQENTMDLMVSGQINDVGEQDIGKVGWLQVVNNTMPSVDFGTLRRRLKIIPLNCATTPFLFDWEINSSHYYKNGFLHLPQDLQLIYNNISNLMTNEEENIAVIDEKLSLGVQVNVLDITTFAEEDNFSFNAEIFRHHGRELKLILTFFSGLGKFFVDVFNQENFTEQSFEVEVNASLPVMFPVEYEHELSSDVFKDMQWVCVYQGDKQLCQLVGITETPENVTAETSALHISHNLLTLFSRNSTICNDSNPKSEQVGSTYILYFPLFLIFFISVVSLMVYYKKNYFFFVGKKCKNMFWNKFTQVDNENLI